MGQLINKMELAWCGANQQALEDMEPVDARPGGRTNQSMKDWDQSGTGSQEQK